MAIGLGKPSPCQKMVQTSTNRPRFHSSGTNLCSVSESPCFDYVCYGNLSVYLKVTIHIRGDT